MLFLPRSLLLCQPFLSTSALSSPQGPGACGCWESGLGHRSLPCRFSFRDVLSVPMDAPWPSVGVLLQVPEGGLVSQTCLPWVRNSYLQLLWRLLGSVLWGHHKPLWTVFLLPAERPSGETSGPGPDLKLFLLPPVAGVGRWMPLSSSTQALPPFPRPIPLPLFASTHIHALNKTFH